MARALNPIARFERAMVIIEVSNASLLSDMHVGSRCECRPEAVEPPCKGGEVSGKTFDGGGDGVGAAGGKAEKDFGDAECLPFQKFVGVGFEVQGDNLWGAVAIGGGPAVLQELDRLVDCDIAGGGDPTVRATGNPFEVLFGTGGADQDRDMGLGRFGPSPAGPEVDEFAVVFGLLLGPQSTHGF